MIEILLNNGNLIKTNDEYSTAIANLGEVIENGAEFISVKTIKGVSVTFAINAVITIKDALED